MLNVSEPVKQEMAEAFAFVADKLKETLYLGDLLIDDEGVAFTHTVNTEVGFEKLVLTVEVQKTFQERAAADLEKVRSAMEELTSSLKKEVKVEEEA